MLLLGPQDSGLLSGSALDSREEAKSPPSRPAQQVRGRPPGASGAMPIGGALPSAATGKPRASVFLTAFQQQQQRKQQAEASGGSQPFAPHEQQGQAQGELQRTAAAPPRQQQQQDSKPQHEKVQTAQLAVQPAGLIGAHYPGQQQQAVAQQAHRPSPIESQPSEEGWGLPSGLMWMQQPEDSLTSPTARLDLRGQTPSTFFGANVAVAAAAGGGDGGLATTGGIQVPPEGIADAAGAAFSPLSGGVQDGVDQLWGQPSVEVHETRGVLTAATPETCGGGGEQSTPVSPAFASIDGEPEEGMAAICLAVNSMGAWRRGEGSTRQHQKRDVMHEGMEHAACPIVPRHGRHHSQVDHWLNLGWSSRSLTQPQEQLQEQQSDEQEPVAAWQAEEYSPMNDATAAAVAVAVPTRLLAARRRWCSSASGKRRSSTSSGGPSSGAGEDGFYVGSWHQDASEALHGTVEEAQQDDGSHPGSGGGLMGIGEDGGLLRLVETEVFAGNGGGQGNTLSDDEEERGGAGSLLSRDAATLMSGVKRGIAVLAPPVMPPAPAREHARNAWGGQLVSASGVIAAAPRVAASTNPSAGLAPATEVALVAAGGDRAASWMDPDDGFDGPSALLL